jgi:hypothetical protein
LATHPLNRKDNPMNIISEKTPSTAGWPGFEDQAGLIAMRIGIWNDNGYPEPLPFQGAHPVPPPGQRSAGNINPGHGAIEAIVELIRDLHAPRAQLVTEVRANQAARAVQQRLPRARHVQRVRPLHAWAGPCGGRGQGSTAYPAHRAPPGP